jgi:uncharacterized membrane protein YgaE (UPF0421/DUF939 family)
VLKTFLAVTLAIFLAQTLHLQQAHFAGIVAVLSVQPSLYRSLRHGLQQMASAFFGALTGSVFLAGFGNSYLVMGLVALFLMTLHVKIKWTNSLLISVVISVNTMGAASHFFGDSALNQLALVLIGTLSGALLNLLHRPVYRERAEDLLLRSEGMLRALLYYLCLDLEQQTVTPYPQMRRQIEEVRHFLDQGKDYSRLIQEDRRFHRVPPQNTATLFHTMESMVERIRDITKELQKADVSHPEILAAGRILGLTIRVQEHKLKTQKSHTQLLIQVVESHQQHVLQLYGLSMMQQLPFLNLYHHLLDYLHCVETLDTQTLSRLEPISG